MPNLIPGEYLARAIETQWCLSSAGTKALAVQFELIGGNGQDFAEGQTITWWGYFTDKTWERTVQALRFMGFVGEDLTELGSLEETVSITLKNEEYEGRMHTKVAWVNKVGGKNISVNNPMDDRSVEQFAAAMRNRISSMQGHTPTNNKPKSDEVPF